MKKIFTLFSAMLMSIASFATTYNGTLTVTVNGEVSEQPTSVSIDEVNGNYKLSINNFMLVAGETNLPVGNIVIDHVPGAVNGGLTTLCTNQEIQILAGNVEGIAEEDWLGPLLGTVPVEMNARFTGEGYVVTDIHINMVELGQVIDVKFENVGTHFQMPNSDFETWSTANNAPKHWHGFESVKGSLSGSAYSETKLVSSNNVRPGSKGLTSAVVTSTKVFTVIANGTMTNGRLAAGSISATNSANHSETKLSSTDVDANGDPFATPMYAKPDSVKFWMRFTQAKAQASNPLAAFNAVITDGTYYQDPEDKDYTNKVAVAAPNKADMTVGDWRLVSCPFDYASYAANGAEAKAILLTVSTNATPGKGSYSNGVADSVYVDDLELVYAAGIKSISFKGQALDLATIQTTGIELAADEAVSAADFEVVKEGEDAKVTKLVEATADGYVAVITAVSADLKTQVAYEINIKKPAAPVLKGDINGDGVLDVADASALIDMVLNSGTCTEVADVNGDGALDVADVTELITLILG
ncbi:MAG: calycin-like domain-containing protein [Sodaliphilus sp.]|nr:calycin-like domain-containing protein [Sodaliphilus sp.]